MNNNFNDVDKNIAFDPTNVLRISFAYGSCNNKYRESFTIIGADSSLFHTGIPHQKYFVLGQA